MGKLIWDEIGERLFETGIDHVVLYPVVSGVYPKGYAWSGVTSINENRSGAEDNFRYADNMKYFNIKSAEEVGLTLECFYYPDAWTQCNGEGEIIDGITISQQKRKNFGLSYRTLLGNDTEQTDYGYKLHLAYGCSAAPSEIAYNTVNESPEANTLSYTISTTPVAIDGFKPAALITIDATKLDDAGKLKLKELEAILYGKDGLPETPAVPDSYVVTSSEPIDWATNYGSYYTEAGGVYTQVTDATAPTWAADTYYSKIPGSPAVPAVEGIDARLPLPAEIVEMFAVG